METVYIWAMEAALEDFEVDLALFGGAPFSGAIPGAFLLIWGSRLGSLFGLLFDIAFDTESSRRRVQKNDPFFALFVRREERRPCM